MNDPIVPNRDERDYHRPEFLKEHKINYKTGLVAGTLLLGAVTLSNCGAGYEQPRTIREIYKPTNIESSIIDEPGNRGCTYQMEQEVAKSLRRVGKCLYNLLFGEEKEEPRHLEHFLPKPYPRKE